MKDQLIETLTLFEAGEITLQRAVDSILLTFGHSADEPALHVHDIRNKLSSITMLIELLEGDQITDEIRDDFLPKTLKRSKESVNYLAQREVYAE